MLAVLEALRTRVGGTIHDDRYLKAWSDLKYPGQRADLIEYLKVAQNPTVFSDLIEIESLVHFIFDDHDFQPASEQRGFTLLNDAEEDVIEAFVSALDRAIGQEPRNCPMSLSRIGVR